MTHVIDGLEGANLVERQADRSDRRARRIVLTAAGAQALQRTAERLRAEESRLLFGLSEARRRYLPKD
jgi:MarR family transcriptional regulator for hemolysin